MPEFTYEDALLALRNQVAKKGALHVYEKPLHRDVFAKVDPEDQTAMHCVNWTLDGQPSCIVGHVVADLGLIPTSDVKRRALARSSAQGLLHGLGVPVTLKAALLLARVQDKQDSGVPWGLAVERGVEAVRDMPEHGERYL